MKKCLLFTLGILVFNFTFSQEIKIETNKIDEYNDIRTIATSFVSNINYLNNDYVDINNSLLFSIVCSKSKEHFEYYSISFLTTNASLGCLSKYDGKCVVFFENEETLEFVQVSETNCDNRISATYSFISREFKENPEFFNIMLNNLQKMLSNKVKKIRIYGTKKSVDFILKEDKQDIIIKHIKAINALK